MTGLAPSILPADLEPAGALQHDVCEWERLPEPRDPTPSAWRACNGHLLATIGIVTSWNYCPWCGKTLQMIEVEQ